MEFAQASEKAGNNLDLWNAETPRPMCSSENILMADDISNAYEDDAISTKYVTRRGVKVLPPWGGNKIGKLRMRIADAAYAKGCLDIAKNIYTDIHESYNNHIVDAYVSSNKKARARTVAINQKQQGHR